MKKRLALVHTGAGVVDPIVKIVKSITSDVELFNFVDDSCVRSIANNNNVIPAAVINRITTLVRYGENVGADAVLVTCSSISEIVDIAKNFVSIPVFKIDEPMIEKAVNDTTNCIGVAATLDTTLIPTIRQIESKAKLSKKSIQIKSALCKGAFSALQEGRPEQHDEIVQKEIKNLLNNCDIVLLAQASMARASDIFADSEIKILTSPLLGVGKVIEYLNR